MLSFLSIVCILLAILFMNVGGFSLPDEGKWDFNLTSEASSFVRAKSLFKGAQIVIQVDCATELHDSSIDVSVLVRRSKCWDFSQAGSDAQDFISQPYSSSAAPLVQPLTQQYKCTDHILINLTTSRDHGQQRPVVHIDGVYVLIFKATATPAMAAANKPLNLLVHVEMFSSYGYLSAVDWPLLPFYGCMCAVYVVLGAVWLLLLFLQWRDLVRVQYWIGAVILLGMIEEAVFYAEYQGINTSGRRVQGAMLFAEWVSCTKRTLARMLVVIVSLGFGIVKPRLGATLHRVVAVGILYWLLAVGEAYLRIAQPKNDNNARELLVASVPLAMLDSAICWWIFSALVNTTRTLRLRRNEIKLRLYKHFTNTLMFAVAASALFILYSIRVHRMVDCLVVWKNLWLEDAYWHMLFSALLVVIMVLWRPSNNNQRYAFVPLLDVGDGNDEDDEEETHFVNNAYGVLTVRTSNREEGAAADVTSNYTATNHKHSTNSVDDDIRWLEENVKCDPALPILDSDEELVTTRFEVSKMQ